MSRAPARTLTLSERDWLAVRSYLSEHRHELADAAAGDYPPDRRVAGTPLLAAPGWQPAAPVPLGDISLELADASLDDAGRAAEFDVATPLLPRRADGTRYARYSEAMAELAAPLVFENRGTYRLTEAELSGLAGSSSNPDALGFSALGDNAPCPCGSAVTFRECHGRPL